MEIRYVSIELSIPDWSTGSILLKFVSSTEHMTILSQRLSSHEHYLKDRVSRKRMNSASATLSLFPKDPYLHTTPWKLKMQILCLHLDQDLGVLVALRTEPGAERTLLIAMEKGPDRTGICAEIALKRTRQSRGLHKPDLCSSTKPWQDTQAKIFLSWYEIPL